MALSLLMLSLLIRLSIADVVVVVHVVVNADAVADVVVVIAFVNADVVAIVDAVRVIDSEMSSTDLILFR